MVPLSVGRFPRGCFPILVVVAATLSNAQSFAPSLGPSLPGSQPVACCSSNVSYLGVYSSDGKFRVSSPSDRSSSTVGIPSSHESASSSRLRPTEVPGFVNLHPLERVVENYEPPAHAIRPAKRRSFLAALRDQIVTFAYGREGILLSPQHGAVDSRGRIIVTDPSAGVVHVLDDSRSFAIAAGENRRLRQPNGVAVDAADNIYVVDSDRGIIVVYDPNGAFLRYIGKLDDESLFHHPTSIAIDRQVGRIYLLDTPRDVLFMLDLEGNILKRVGRNTTTAIGRYAGNAATLDLDNPTKLAIGGGELVLLDSGGSRVQILDLQCNLLARFGVYTSDRTKANEMGLGIDSDGDVYVSNLGDSRIRVYDRDGHFRRFFGQTGSGPGQFRAPLGLWIGHGNRMYVADTSNRRVQVFQLTTPSLEMSLESWH